VVFLFSIEEVTVRIGDDAEREREVGRIEGWRELITKIGWCYNTVSLDNEKESLVSQETRRRQEIQTECRM